MITIMMITKSKIIILITTSPKLMKKSSILLKLIKMLSLSHYLTTGD